MIARRPRAGAAPAGRRLLRPAPPQLRRPQGRRHADQPRSAASADRPPPVPATPQPRRAARASSRPARAAQGGDGGRVKASPAGPQHGRAPEHPTLVGAGQRPGGRIIKRDIEIVVRPRAPSAAPARRLPGRRRTASAPPGPSITPGQELPSRDMRKTIAKRPHRASSVRPTSTSRSRSTWTRRWTCASSSSRREERQGLVQRPRDEGLRARPSPASRWSTRPGAATRSRPTPTSTSASPWPSPTGSSRPSSATPTASPSSRSRTR